MKLWFDGRYWNATFRSGDYMASAYHKSKFRAIAKAVYRTFRFRFTNKPYYTTLPVVNHRIHSRVDIRKVK